MLDEGAQEPELERCQSEIDSPRLGGTLAKLHRDRVVGVHGRQIFFCPSLPAEERLHAGEQLLAAERLRQIVVRAGLQAPHLLELVENGR